jgi:hypothetical protein
LAVEEHDAVGQGEEGIVFGPADIAAGVEHGAPLPNDDPAGANRLTAEDFDAQALTVRLAAVPDRTLTFLMSHNFLKF